MLVFQWSFWLISIYYQDFIKCEICSPALLVSSEVVPATFFCPSGLNSLKETDEGRGADYAVLMEKGSGSKRIWLCRKRGEKRDSRPWRTEGWRLSGTKASIPLNPCSAFLFCLKPMLSSPSSPTTNSNIALSKPPQEIWCSKFLWRDANNLSGNTENIP